MAYSSISELLADIDADSKKYAETYVRAGATEAKNQIVEFTKMALDIFYGSYTPKVYDREGNIKDNSYEPILEISGESGRGGVSLSSSGMHEYWKIGHWKDGTPVTTEDVFQWVMFGGWHGNAAQTKAPYDIIEKFAKGASFANYIRKYAENAARKESYKILFK